MGDRNAGRFGRASAGAPFIVYNLTNYSVRQYAVSPGDQLTDTWPVADKAAHHFCVYSPNGFFWNLWVVVSRARWHRTRRRGRAAPSSAELVIRLSNLQPQPVTVEWVANACQHPPHRYKLSATGAKTSSATRILPLTDRFGWYDFSVRVVGHSSFAQRYAGRVETGASSFSDPVMGRVEI